MNKLMKYLLFILFALLIGIALATSNYLLLFVAVSSVVFLVMFNNIRFTIYSLIMSVSLLDWLWEYVTLLPRQITWLPEILSLILLIRIFYDLAADRIKVKNNFITYFVYIWLFLSIIGIIANSVSSYIFIAGLRNYFKFIPLLLVFSWYQFPEEFIKRIIGFVVFIGIIQIFFVIPERIIFWKDEGDLIVGSLGAHASGTLAIFELLIFSMIVALYRCNYYSFKKFITYSIIVLLPTFITEAKVIFFLLPITFAIYFLDFKREMFARSVLLLASGLVLLVAGAFVYNSIYAGWRGKDIRAMIFSPQRTKDELGMGQIATAPGGELRRLSAVQFMFQNISKDTTYTRILGVGVGNASDSLFPIAKGQYHKKYPELQIDSVFLARFGWEFGYSGLILFVIFLSILFFIRRYKDYGPFYNGIFHGVKGLVFVTIASSIYNSFLTLDALALFFWLYIGILNSKLLEEKV